MAKQRPEWVTDVKVFIAFTLLNYVLLMAGAAGAVSGGWRQAGTVLMWVFATPACVARELGYQELVNTLFLVNPLVYGLVWWAVWRMVKLFRAKPAG